MSSPRPPMPGNPNPAPHPPVPPPMPPPLSDFTWGAHKPGEATGEGSAASPSSRLINEGIRGGWL